MWLRDLSLAWRPKSLSGLPLAMENCLRHFPSTFAPYESCIRHSPSLTNCSVFMPFFTCKPRWWLFNLAHRLPPERFCEVDKHSGGQVLQQVFLLISWMGGSWCVVQSVRRDDLLYSAAALSAARLLQWKSLETHTVVPRLQLWVRVLSGNVLVAYDCG